MIPTPRRAPPRSGRSGYHDPWCQGLAYDVHYLSNLAELTAIQNRLIQAGRTVPSRGGEQFPRTLSNQGSGPEEGEQRSSGQSSSSGSTRPDIDATAAQMAAEEAANNTIQAQGWLEWWQPETDEATAAEQHASALRKVMATLAELPPAEPTRRIQQIMMRNGNLRGGARGDSPSGSPQRKARRRRSRQTAPGHRRSGRGKVSLEGEAGADNSIEEMWHNLPEEQRASFLFRCVQRGVVTPCQTDEGPVEVAARVLMLGARRRSP